MAATEHGPGKYVVKSDLPLLPDGLDINLAAADNVIEALFASDDMPADWLNASSDAVARQLSGASCEVAEEGDEGNLIGYMTPENAPSKDMPADRQNTSSDASRDRTLSGASSDVVEEGDGGNLVGYMTPGNSPTKDTPADCLNTNSDAIRDRTLSGASSNVAEEGDGGNLVEYVTPRNSPSKDPPADGVNTSSNAIRDRSFSDDSFDVAEEGHGGSLIGDATPGNSPSRSHQNTSCTQERALAKKDALFFELTETFDDCSMADDSNFGLDVNTLGKIADQFSKGERMPEILKYELTEELPELSDKNWHDSEFGFSDEQLETLWKRFGAHMGNLPSESDETCSSTVIDNKLRTPAPKTLEKVEEEHTMPCTQALQTVEEALDNTGLVKLNDFIGQETLEQFIGQAVPELPRAGMRAWMVSTHNFDGEDWYLFKVNDRSTNRFYMKTFPDFEELCQELQKVSVSGGGSYDLPQLQARDFFGIKRFFGGADFDAHRTTELKTYVSELMSRSLSPSQEQVLRLFFGPNARGRIMPPKGPIHRGLAYGSRTGSGP